MSKVKEYQRQVTAKGVVVIPAEIRRLLGLKLGRVVRFRMSGRQVVLLPPNMTLEETLGSVRPKRRPLNLKRTRDKAIEEHVRGVVSKICR